MRTIIVFLFIANISFAQLGLKEAEVIKLQGKYWKREADENYINLYYKSVIIHDGEKISEVILYKIDNETKICAFVVYSAPLKAIDSYTKLLNSMSVQEYEDYWTDYKNNSYYKLYTNGEFVSIEHGYINSSSQTTNCETEKEKLVTQIQSLKKNNEDLQEALKKITNESNKTVQNLEKALKELEKRDLKIEQLEKVIKK
ncbi:hypothetical protein [Flavobacterium wongokense]|uniref:hypothetical protein n=1 Tax=Flavobacterium wongokense TaxID=2910674 RepID=UPI001F266915|nr:hypothetical protein [Flavobacterium sp. WG47]MCF6133434.1 hypothetical protein [Flavobacterium sp. WG47]